MAHHHFGAHLDTATGARMVPIRTSPKCTRTASWGQLASIRGGVDSQRALPHGTPAQVRDAGMDVDLTATIRDLEEEMLTAANNLEFEKAALLRDQIRELKRAIDGSQPAKQTVARPLVSYRAKRRSSARR